MKPTQEQLEDQLLDALLHEGISRGLDAQDFGDANNDYENDVALLQQMKLRWIDQQIAGNVADSSTLSARGATTLQPASRKAFQPSSNVGDSRRMAAANSLPLPSIDESASAPSAPLPEIAAPMSSLAMSGGKGMGGATMDGPSTGKGSGSGAGLGKARSLAANGVTDALRQEQPNTERYGPLVDPSWQRPSEHPLSTFSIDVDNASYSNIRRMIRDGQTIPPDSVRIEECVNAFDYNYAKPISDKAFAVLTTLATCPWNEQHLLMKVGIKGREIPANQRPVSNLVFLIDVSGSMQDSNKPPLVKESIKLLLHQLNERDSVSYVVYADSEGVVLPQGGCPETR